MLRVFTLLLGMFSVPLVFANTIDFEDFNVEGTLVSSLTFDDFSMSNGRIAKPGGALQGFGVIGGQNDDAGSGNSVAPLVNPNTPLTITFFDSVSNVSFDIADLDNEDSVEVLVFTNQTDLTPIETIQLANSPSLDGALLGVALSSTSISRIEFDFFGDDHTWTLDNLSYGVVPLPPAFGMFSLGLLALLGLTRTLRSH